MGDLHALRFGLRLHNGHSQGLKRFSGSSQSTSSGLASCGRVRGQNHPHKSKSRASESAISLQEPHRNRFLGVFSDFKGPRLKFAQNRAGLPFDSATPSPNTDKQSGYNSKSLFFM